VFGDPNATLGGVGVIEQPELVSYIVERKPLVAAGGGTCDPNSPWVPIGGVVPQGIGLSGGSPLATSVVVPVDVCVRLTTHFGRIPTQALRLTPADNPTRNQNRFDAQAGNMGDLGFEVSSPEKAVGGNLLSDTPILRGTSWSSRNLVVNFETLAEISVESFGIVVRDRRGATTEVLQVDCQQCSGGIGQSYHAEIPGTAVRSAKSIFVVAHPSGATSEEVPISRTPERPERPTRGGGRGR
jgi:hypothetical protein